MAAGVRADFEEAFPGLLRRAFRVAFRILGNETLAEDAAAEALARAHASWSKVGKLTYREAWVLRVAANVAIDMVRKGRRVVPMADPWSARGPEEADEREAAILRIALVAALGNLPRRQREVVTLHYLEGLSENEIAQCLRVSIGTVKKTNFRARAALRRVLGEDWQTAAPDPAPG
jgi:RNA polymerase sigma factor (sigma-70 family)